MCRDNKSHGFRFYVSETWGQDLKDGKVSAKDDAYRQGYENVKYMMDHSWEDTYSVDQTTCDARFVKGEAAMQMDGSWCINNYLTLDESFEFGMFPVPNEDGSAAHVLYGTDCLQSLSHSIDPVPGHAGMTASSFYRNLKPGRPLVSHCNL